MYFGFESGMRTTSLGVLGLLVLALFLCAGCVASKPGYAYERVERTRRAVGKAETFQWVERIRPYALMSELAYQSDKVVCTRLARQVKFRHYLESAGWQLLTNRNDPTVADENSPGLHFYIWENRSLPQPQIVIAFRGTESKDCLDWKANTRWMRPCSRRHDQYEQARQYVFEYLRNRPASTDTNVLIVTTGHSLGAGLAQTVFYSSFAEPSGCQVTECYAFNPSPVTGALQFGTRGERQSARTSRNQTQAAMAGDKVKGESCLGHFDFGIVRIYEQGEILAYPRSWLRLVWPLHPLLTELKFNFKTRGNVVGQHAMSDLAESLYQIDQPAQLE